MANGKRSRTAAPGYGTLKKRRGSRKQLTELTGFHSDGSKSKLRHTTLLTDSDGRPTQQLSLIPLNDNLQNEETEQDTFEHYLNDGDWVDDHLGDANEWNTGTQRGKKTQKKKVSILLRLSRRYTPLTMF